MAASSKKAIYAALVGNGLISVTKFIAAAVTGSSAMMSEGIHSVVDTGNQVLLLWGIRQSKKPPDERFPFGHGKEIYIFDGVASIIIGLILAGTAAWLAFETKGLLIGESATREVVDGVRAIVGKHDTVERVNEVLTMHMGPEFVLLNLSVEFRDESTAPDLEQAIGGIEREIKGAFPEVKRIFIEAETLRAGGAGGAAPA